MSVNLNDTIVPNPHMVREKFTKRLCIIKNFSIKDLPDRTKIFLSALMFWVYVMYYFNKVVGCILGFVLKHTPDSCIIYHPTVVKAITKKEPDVSKPDILDARMGAEIITNKLNMLIKTHWDTEINDLGGVNVKDLVSKFPALSTSVIWIAYLFDLDKKLQSMSNEDIGNTVRYMLINLSDKTIYRDSTLDTDEEILFGEIPF